MPVNSIHGKKNSKLRSVSGDSTFGFTHIGSIDDDH